MLGASITLTSYYIIGVPASVLMGLVWKWGPFVSGATQTVPLGLHLMELESADIW